MKISIIQATNRPGGIDILKHNLDRQTFKDFEVILADDLYNWRKNEVADMLGKYRLKHFLPRQKEGGDAWNLNKCYNDALALAEGNLVVSLQDYIWIKANGLERFWKVYQQTKRKAMITGVGHKAALPEKLDFEPHEAKVKSFHKVTKPTGISETDDRVAGERGLVDSDWTYYELNWSCCPRKLFPSFEEDMDKYYGGENQVVALKFNLNGGKIYIDRSNECVGYNQALFGRPADWEEKHHNKENRLNEKIQQIIKKYNN